MTEPLLIERSVPGRRGVRLPACDVPEVPLADLLPASQLASEPPPLSEISEMDVVRHFTRLSALNYGVDTGFYPLGSCTMKYNPKLHEEIARLAGFARLHPLAPEEACQGMLRLLWELEQALKEIAGFARVTLQPAAGAHGELAALLMIQAYFSRRGEARTIVIIPDSAHGTNPASARLAGFDVAVVRSNAGGRIDTDHLKTLLSDRTAAIMITNPNTLGLFEDEIATIADLVHAAGGLVYLDGANLNALLGIARPGDMGFDVVHFNLHKTFSTPHGGGGPGSGPVGVTEALVPFLPIPTIEQEGARYVLAENRPLSIGRLHGFHGNALVLVRAYAYIRTLGPEGLRRVAEHAILNANYLKARLAGAFEVPFDRVCQHEFVLSARRFKEKGVGAWDIAKRLLDYGMHPPTVYFPLIVPEALMIEPPETESKETLDAFADALLAVAVEAEKDPDLIRRAPHTMPVRRLDEVRAARQPDLRWREVE
jgi:glycine dehydrogenase subunit 2